LPHAIMPDELFSPWGEDVVAAIGDRHHLHIYDVEQPPAGQFDGIDVVIDHGGSLRGRELADAAAGKIKLWQILGTGVDHFPLDYWCTKGIPVANTPGPFSAVALAECAMMFILMLTRRYPLARANLEKSILYGPLGRELVGMRLGIIGFGASGQELALRAAAFGMKIAAIDIREISTAEVDRFQLDFAGKPSALDEVIATSDVVSLHLHLTKETHHLINRQRLARMKPTAFLLNVARGALVDEEALVEALVAGRIGGARIDAYGQEPPDLRSPLFQLPNVIATPHSAGVTDGTSRKRAQACANNVDRIAAGLEPLYLVCAAETQLGFNH
ncbi:MAG TPA: NAD(P)-dependent oxidoreductase, partial [Caldilineaceae bacterium]|nr:NAD(P)-dependent oxidoreductase [Caldilineaceae bacterium]